MPKTNLLDKINYPSDLRKLKREELKQLSKELREEFHIKILTHSERKIKKVSWNREIKEF